MVTVLFPFLSAWSVGVLLMLIAVGGVHAVSESEKGGESILAAIFTVTCGYAAFKILAACFGALS